MADKATLEALVAENRQAILATINRDGRPQLTNILYLWDAEQEVALMTTTATRLKARNLRRDPRCSLHVERNFWAYAVADGEAEISAAAERPGDEVCRELLPLYTALMGAPEDEAVFFDQMVAEQRVLVRFRYSRVHGVIAERSTSD
jgi:PPOX class probable F420-dependent enzyme